MTDVEIKQALEYCTGIRKIESCSQCPACVGCNDCVDILRECALDFINRLEADKEALIAGQESLQKYITEKNKEIERLETSRKHLKLIIQRLKKKILSAKVEAIKEFAARLKEKSRYPSGTIYIEHIDNLVKEMVGDAE